MMLSTCRVLLVLLIVQYVECLRLVSSGKSITSSSAHKTWSADKAIDGNAIRNPSTCKCCAATNDDKDPWYELDLTKIYSIHDINVVGRGADDDRDSSFGEVGFGHTLEKMEIKLGTNKSDETVQTTVNDRVYLYNYTLSAPKLARYVRLTLRDKKQYFVICELYVYADCAGKTYGKDCDDKCGKCVNSEACDSDNGNCSACSPGYQSPLCQGLRLVSSGKSITSSSAHKTWSADKAIDGNAIRNPSTCKCCAATNDDKDPWYELDLTKIYSIHDINVVGRGADDDRDSSFGEVGFGLGNYFIVNANNIDPDQGERLLNESDIFKNNGYLQQPYNYWLLDTLEKMEIKLGTNKSDETVQTTVNDRVYLYNYTLSAPKLARYVRLTLRDKKQYFVICELYVYADCAGKTYGKDCDDKCGKCVNSEACDSDNGNCSACSPGYQSPLCQECEGGYYGESCSNKCGICRKDENCDKKNGTCTSCLTGYKPPICQECDDGFFGDSCVFRCRCADGPCNKTSGKCPNGGCTSGYEGEKCDKKCQPGTYGKSCVHQCGSCADNQPCTRTTGLCDNGCFPGSIGAYCNMTCKDGFYGDRCNTTCDDQCGENVVCRKTDGLCPQKFDNETENVVYIVLPVVGGLLLASLLVSLLVITMIKVKRRQAQEVPRRPARFAPTLGNHTIRTFSVNDERQSFIAKGRQTETVAAHKNIAESEYTSLSADKAQSNNEICEETANLTDVDDEHQYYGFAVKESDLKVYQLWDFIHERRKEKDLMFHREFAQFPTGLRHPHETALRQEIKPKNRYKRMYAWICSDKKVHRFSRSYERDERCFWRMIWQQKSQQVVMLTNLIEMKVEKCLIYWPTDGEVTYSGITVSKLSEVDFGDYVVRKLNVRQTTQNPRLVTQYHFKMWPDKDVPDNTWSLVNFWRTVAKDRDTMTDSGPIVVHCSAGIGRTGTFIALDHAYHQAKLEGSLRFPSIIRTLREQRVNMVQTCHQYIYVHEAVADALLFGTHSLWSKQFDEVYCFLKQFEPGTDLPRLRIQYDLIVSSIEAKEKEMTDLEGTEVKQQTDMIHIGNPSLCATLLPNTKEKDAYIVAKTPDKKDIPDLWSLIYERNTKTIITLIDANSQDGDIESFHSDEKTQQISLLEKKDKGDHSERTLSYTPSDSSSKCVTVKQFVYSKCSEDENEPVEAKAMIGLIENVLLWQQDISDLHPILVHCSTGSKLSGLVCVLLNELNRIKTEKECLHIVLSVKLMKKRNKDIIPCFEQYRYIHEVIRCFLDGGGLYANV